MKVELMPGIKAISGKSNGILFKTFKRLDGSVETRAYLTKPAYGQRKSKPSKKEMATRDLFIRRQAYVKELMSADPCLSKAAAWKIAKIKIV